MGNQFESMFAAHQGAVYTYHLVKDIQKILNEEYIKFEKDTFVYFDDVTEPIIPQNESNRNREIYNSSQLNESKRSNQAILDDMFVTADFSIPADDKKLPKFKSTKELCKKYNDYFFFKATKDYEAIKNTNEKRKTFLETVRASFVDWYNEHELKQPNLSEIKNKSKDRNDKKRITLSAREREELYEKIIDQYNIYIIDHQVKTATLKALAEDSYELFGQKMSWKQLEGRFNRGKKKC